MINLAISLLWRYELPRSSFRYTFGNKQLACFRPPSYDGVAQRGIDFGRLIMIVSASELNMTNNRISSFIESYEA
jgi:hypothetical protein